MQLKNSPKLLFFLLLLFLITAAILFVRIFLRPSSPSALSSLKDHSVIIIQHNQNRLRLEVVNTPQSTEQGLSDRKEIGADGMLFVFPQTMVQYFWMKEMLFDLDMVWLENLKVIGITENVPRPKNIQQTAFPSYSSGSPVNQVLELNAGDARKLQLKVGDTFSQVE